MSTDVRPLLDAVHSSSSTSTVAPPLATGAPPLIAPTVSATTLATHAVDRANARLEGLHDELDLLRAESQAGDEFDVAESRLLHEIVAAERALKACASMAAEVSKAP